MEAKLTDQMKISQVLQFIELLYLERSTFDLDKGRMYWSIFNEFL